MSSSERLVENSKLHGIGTNLVLNMKQNRAVFNTYETMSVNNLNQFV
jgi:hypothetical protein